MTTTGLPLHRRRSIRLPGYDYALAGAYFVTLTAQGQSALFGEIIGGEMRANDAGQMVARWWAELSHRFTEVETDVYTVMPNHFHGIVVINEPDAPPYPVGADLCVCPNMDGNKEGGHVGPPLPTLIQWFKTMTTNEYMRCVKSKSWPPFERRLWQRNYYEHIIRNEDSLNRIRAYISNNPAQWLNDKENLASASLHVRGYATAKG